MRARELRLRRSLRGVVAALLAAPLGVASACSATRDDPSASPDASLGGDGGAHVTSPDSDATAQHDALSTVDGGAWSAEACASIAIDGAPYDNNPDGCSTFYTLPCGLPRPADYAGPLLEGCYVYLQACAAACPTQSLYCILPPAICDDAGVVLADAATLLECVGACGIAGRPPRGLEPAPLAADASPGDYFAAAAHMEAASVRAFADLERSLLALGAPVQLTRATRRAARDERRHARRMRRLAKRFGGVTPRVRVGRTAPPSLPDLLTDDAVAGCVGETFAALVATWQAERAEDPRVRRTLRAIAADETRHAALAWEVLRWGLSRVGPRERAEVQRAMQTAAASLVATRVDWRKETRRVTGHPPRDVEVALADAVATIAAREWERLARFR